MNRLIASSVLVGVLATGPLALEKTKQAPGAIAPQIAVLLEAHHVSGGVLDDERSGRIFDAYFGALDPGRMYFRQSDVDAFSGSREELDDQFRRADFDFAIEAGEALGDRVEAVSSLIEPILDAAMDFSRNEYGLATPGGARFPASDEELRTVWRKSLKARVLERIVGLGESAERARSVVREELEAAHAAMRSATPAERIERFIDVVTASFDPHTRYLRPDDLGELEIQLRQRLVGVGVVLRAENGRNLVGSLVPGGPAAREGTMRDGDEIVAIAEGSTGPWVDLAGKGLRDVVRGIRGAAGTMVRLRLRRGEPGGKATEVTAAIRRASVRLRQLEAHGQVEEVPGEPGSDALAVGVLRVPTFYSGTAAAVSPADAPPGEAESASSSTMDCRRWIGEFASRGVEAIVLDLRGNAGGLLEEAVGVASLFLDGGPVAQIADRGAVRVVHDVDGERAWGGPLVVLTDRLTASASEIVAGALEDHGRALVVGDASTHGKGTVQTLVPVIDPRSGASRGALKVTTAKFYLPSGPSPQLVGVVPHIALPSTASVRSAGESGLAGALPFDEIPPAVDLHPGGLPARVLASVDARSRERRRDSAWFRDMESDLLRALEARGERWMPLELDRFAARRASLSASRPDPAAGITGRENRFERDPYLDEVLAITRDYVRESRTD